VVSLGALKAIASYAISMTFVDGHVLTYTFSLEVKCGASSTITQTILTHSYQYDVEDPGTEFTFDPFVCSIPACCTTLVHKFTTDLLGMNIVDSGLITQPALSGAYMES
jgi:hypothetical protein